MTEARFPGTAPVDAYGNGGFRFADMSHRGSILCLPDGIRAWSPRTMADVTEKDFDIVFSSESRPELILIGTGERHLLLPESLKLAFGAARVRVDAMATGAAARTYNVLLAEGRSVGAALLAVD